MIATSQSIAPIIIALRRDQNTQAKRCRLLVDQVLMTQRWKLAKKENPNAQIGFLIALLGSRSVHELYL